MNGSLYTQFAAEQESRRRDKALECVAIDANTLHQCGCTDSEKCACGCERPVCEDHGVQLFGLHGLYLPACAKLELDADDLCRMEAGK